MLAAGDAALPLLAPAIEKGLGHDDWRHREAAITVCVSVCMWEDEDEHPPCVPPFISATFPRECCRVRLSSNHAFHPSSTHPSSPLLAGLLAFISGSRIDPSPAVRSTAAYALCSAIQRGPLRAALCEGGRGSSIFHALTDVTLRDEPRVAAFSSSALTHLLADDEVVDDDDRRAAWETLPRALLKRMDSLVDAADPSQATRCQNFFDACDSLQQTLLEECMPEGNEAELLSLLQVTFVAFLLISATLV
jgi:hypothetical protein